MKPASFKLILTVLACITACCVLVWFGYVHIPQSFDGSSPGDFPNYYFSGQRLFDGRPIYADLRDEVMNKLGWKYNAYPADPPFAIALLSPLSFLKYKTAWWTLAIFSFISLCVVVFLTAREAGLSKAYTLIALSLTVCSHPFLFMIKRNHYEMALVFCSVLGWVALRRGRSSAAGILFGIAGALKLFPVLWLLAPFITGKKRALLVGCVSFFALSAIGALIAGVGNMRDFVLHIIPRSSQWYGVVGNYSLISISAALGVPLFGWLISILVGILGLYDLLSGPKHPTSVWIRAITLSLLLSPLCWLNYFVLLIPIAIIMVAGAEPGSRRRLYTFALCAMILSWPSYVPTPSVLCTILASYVPTYGLVIMYFIGGKLAPERDT
jgi:alpha-1,2-mannosyltransferase